MCVGAGIDACVGAGIVVPAVLLRVGLTRREGGRDRRLGARDRRLGLALVIVV